MIGVDWSLLSSWDILEAKWPTLSIGYLVDQAGYLIAGIGRI